MSNFSFEFLRTRLIDAYVHTCINGYSLTFRYVSNHGVRSCVIFYDYFRPLQAFREIALGYRTMKGSKPLFTISRSEYRELKSLFLKNL